MNDEKTDPGRTSAFLEAAYSLGDDEAMQRFYRDWASEYDHQMQEGLAYLSPQKIATLLMRYIEDTQARILDVFSISLLERRGKTLEVSDCRHSDGTKGQKGPAPLAVCVVAACCCWGA